MYFTDSVAYEDFSDAYKKLPVRIDVEEWKDYVAHGVVVKPVVDKIGLDERQKAAFEIKKRDFDRIAKALAEKPG